MIYIIEGHIDIDETPVQYETNDGRSITVTEHPQDEFYLSFEDFDDFISWGNYNIKGFGELE